jgi:hypothetical protein
MLTASNETARDAGTGRTVKLWSLKLGRVDSVAPFVVLLLAGTLLLLSTLRYTSITSPRCLTSEK